MGKNIVICCDGTSNEFADDHTNVVKLFWSLKHGTPDQVAYYHPGLGTMEPRGALTGFTIWATKKLGLAFGYGLLNDIRDSYIFLMNNYVPGDKVYLFGFSRGAYTARALASLLRMYGLIRKNNDALVPYALRMMSAINNLPGHSWGRKTQSKARNDAANTIFDQARQFFDTFSVPCTPYFVGVWDTVSSVGWVSNPYHAPYTTNNPDIEIGRHAMATGERRGFFPVSRWFKSSKSANWGPKNVKQVWFTGDHCDVGGGHPETESGLSKITLEWMVCEAAAAGLIFDGSRFDVVMGYAPVTDYKGQTIWPHAKPDAAGKQHDSINWTTGAGWWWHLAEFFPKRSYDPKTESWPYRWRPFCHRRVVPPADAENPVPDVHDSMLDRSRMPSGANYVKTVYPPQLAATRTALAKNPWVA